MLVPIDLLRKIVDIPVSDLEFQRDFSLKSAEVASFSPLCSIKGLKIGKIIKIADHPDSNHLHITTVDTGDVVEDIVCGAPNVVVNKKVIVAKVGVELPFGTMKKALIRGVESNGMNCALDELGIDHKFQGYDGIYYLDDDAPLGEDPIKYLGFDQNTMEIELTPNRNDLLSILGVAYDTKAMYDSKMHLDELTKKVERIKEENDIDVSTLTDKCNFYYSRVIKGVEIKESPVWLKSYLMRMNIRPINNVVDITNLALMVFGQPLHAFDYDKISTKKIVVRNSYENEKIVTLDEKERELTIDDLVITDGEKTLCLAGIMGGLDSEVTSDTKNIFLECANFDKEVIKKTSKRLSLSSESSMRYEKGCVCTDSVGVLEFVSRLFIDLCNGEILSDSSNELIRSSFDNRKDDNTIIEITLDKINSLLGKKYKVEEVTRIFKSLSFDVEVKGSIIVVRVPKHRPDIETYQDLIEEIVRIDGYEKIVESIPSSTSQGKLSLYQNFLKKIRNILSYNLNEVITYSLTTKEKATYFDNEEVEVISILNPLLDERVSLRHSLIPSMLDVLKYNLNRKVNDNFYFEIGKTYNVEKESPLLSIVLNGMVSNTMWKGEKEVVDFFYLKGLLENLFNKLSVKNYSISVPEKVLKGMHPGVSANIFIGRDKIGYMGKLDPDSENYFEVKNTYVLEIDLEKLFNASHPLKSVKEISKYPTINRDLALVMDDEVSASYLTQEIRRIAKRNLVDIKIFDLYKGENLGNNKKQIALSLVFQDMSKTLSSEEVDNIIKDVLKHLESKGISLRA